MRAVVEAQHTECQRAHISTSSSCSLLAYNLSECPLFSFYTARVVPYACAIIILAIARIILYYIYVHVRARVERLEYFFIVGWSVTEKESRKGNDVNKELL